MVVPELTVAENVFLGRQPLRAGRVDWRQMRDQAAQVMAEWGFAIDVRLPCADLTVEQRQIVEIARALAAGTRCLLLDEPTAALERGAIERLFARVRQLAASGVAILYISHHLEEVFEICQDVAVIRDGELVLTGPAAELTKDQLVSRWSARSRCRPGTGLLRPERPGTAIGPGNAPGPDRAETGDNSGPGTEWHPPGRPAWWWTTCPPSCPAGGSACRWTCCPASGSG